MSSSKLEFPKFTEEPTPTSVNGWIGRCEDTYEAWQGMHPERVADGGAVCENENRENLKKLASFEEFAGKVKERFVPANWKLAVLGEFYAIGQGTTSFRQFAKTLELARNSLTSAGVAYTINDSILKNHLLFQSHPILCLCVIGQPGFEYANMKVDGLIANMSTAWESLVTERVVRESSEPLVVSIPSSVAPLPSTSSAPSLPTPPSSALARPFSYSLTSAEKEALRAAGGCYHCKKTPQSPGWTKHRSDNCPGDTALGIPPRSVSSVVAAVGPIGFSSLYGEIHAVAAVFPAVEDENDSLSEGTDDSDY
ncbi:hypothetical protein B0H16DRAFT_1464383 [Mycena metata]|uniref:Uncharacterized protein n=1 Tax=Mycena metata TaxID=1033252 RepID=A0AAD7IF22_9AGAR|nr:hypothetical protein B0H16DRAFT_1464383 [Mycena metata]